MRDGRVCGDKQRRSSDTKRKPKSGDRQINQVEYDSGVYCAW